MVGTIEHSARGDWWIQSLESSAFHSQEIMNLPWLCLCTAWSGSAKQFATCAIGLLRLLGEDGSSSSCLCVDGLMPSPAMVSSCRDPGKGLTHMQEFCLLCVDSKNKHRYRFYAVLPGDWSKAPAPFSFQAARCHHYR